MSLETNFGMRFRRRPFWGPVYRVRDVISTIVSVVGAVVEFLGTDVGVTLGLGTIGLTWGQVAVAVLSLGLSVWMMSGGKKSGGPESSLEQNGQLVNTRQASKPLGVIYGIMKVGGNWVFSRVSSSNNNLLNNVITWSEGEIEGLAPAIDYTPIYSGSTKNDIHTGGEFLSGVCTCDGSCYSHTDCTCNMMCHATYA